MAGKLPTGSGSSGGDARPRAQVAYEGEDEFSAMSLDPERRKTLKSKEQLKPGAPGAREEHEVNELRSTNNHGIAGFFRKIFAK